MNHGFKWLLVDIGDVLLLKNTDVSFTEQLAIELDIPIDLAREINKAHYTTMDVQYIPEEEFVRSLEKELGYKAPEDIYRYFLRAYEKRIKPNSTMQAFLDEVRAQGIRTAVLSNTIGIYQEAQERAGISKMNGFDPILYSWQLGIVKPNRDIFDVAIEKLGAEPGEIVFIDDKEEHLNGARSAGLKTVLFNGTENTITSLRKILHIE